MKLLVYWADMRGGYSGAVSTLTDVIDENTGKTVGFVDAERSSANGRLMPRFLCGLLPSVQTRKSVFAKPKMATLPT